MLGGYEKLATLPDMLSSPGRHSALLEDVKIIKWHQWLDLCKGEMMNAPPGLCTKKHIYGAMPLSTSINVCMLVNIQLNGLSSHCLGCFCWGTLWRRRGMEKWIETTSANSVRLYTLLDHHGYGLGFLRWINGSRRLKDNLQHSTIHPAPVYGSSGGSSDSSRSLTIW